MIGNDTKKKEEAQNLAWTKKKRKPPKGGQINQDSQEVARKEKISEPAKLS